MSFECKVIADTISHKKRITTLEITYPRFIHAEIMTHRDRARNAGSSRAIPWATMSERIQNHPVIPIKWGLEQKGMQTGDDIPPELAALAEYLWLMARTEAMQYADQIHNIGKTYGQFYGDYKYQDVRIHKSIPNRITEPWMWITVVMTATSWRNFFKQRVDSQAEIHMQEIAKLMLATVKNSDPVEADMHLPYIQEDDWNTPVPLPGPSQSILAQMMKVSTARCARVSYVQHGQKTKSFLADLALGEKLETSGHWSPFEHPAVYTGERSGCYNGWQSYRKWFPAECPEEGYPE